MIAARIYLRARRPGGLPRRPAVGARGDGEGTERGGGGSVGLTAPSSESLAEGAFSAGSAIFEMRVPFFLGI
jgi:hypothetical protein